MNELNEIQVRVLGCLMEKKETTPDQYPLSLNALRNACNQKSSRDPVMNLNEGEVGHAVRELEGMKLVSEVWGSRVPRYEHTVAKALGLHSKGIALLSTLMLRGPQTLGELRNHSNRLYAFDDLDDVQFALQKLAEHEPPLATALPRQPGQKEGRFAHLLCGEPELPEPTAAAAAARPPGRRQNVSSGSPYEPIVGFSRAVRIGNRIAVSGTGPIGPDGETVQGDIAAQMRRCLEISLAALAELGARSLDEVIAEFLVESYTSDPIRLELVEEPSLTPGEPASVRLRVLDPDGHRLDERRVELSEDRERDRLLGSVGGMEAGAEGYLVRLGDVARVERGVGRAGEDRRHDRLLAGELVVAAGVDGGAVDAAVDDRGPDRKRRQQAAGLFKEVRQRQDR